MSDKKNHTDPGMAFLMQFDVREIAPLVAENEDMDQIIKALQGFFGAVEAGQLTWRSFTMLIITTVQIAYVMGYKMARKSQEQDTLFAHILGSSSTQHGGARDLFIKKE